MRKAILSLLLLAGCSPDGRKQPLTHDAYIWQRRWNQSVTQAVQESAPSIHAWRVLAAEVNAAGEWLTVAANQESLRNSRKPVIAVIRTSRLDDHLSAKAAALAAQWNVRGIEIDYDCGTESLPRYRDFLRQFRATLNRRYSLSITALPSWLASHDLPALLSEVDESVLQVHSVMSPKQGLFNKTIAADWARKWSAQTTKPFLIALPTYWSRVSWNQAARASCHSYSSLGIWCPRRLSAKPRIDRRPLAFGGSCLRARLSVSRRHAGLHARTAARWLPLSPASAGCVAPAPAETGGLGPLHRKGSDDPCLVLKNASGSRS